MKRKRGNLITFIRPTVGHDDSSISLICFALSWNVRPVFVDWRNEEKSNGPGFVLYAYQIKKFIDSLNTVDFHLADADVKEQTIADEKGTKQKKMKEWSGNGRAKQNRTVASGYPTNGLVIVEVFQLES